MTSFYLKLDLPFHAILFDICQKPSFKEYSCRRLKQFKGGKYKQMKTYAQHTQFNFSNIRKEKRQATEEIK